MPSRSVVWVRLPWQASRALDGATLDVGQQGLGQECDELTVRRQVTEVGDRDLVAAADPADHPCLLVGALQDIVAQAELVEELERRGMNRVAAEVPEEVAMRLEHDTVGSRPREQEAKHHPRGSAARDAACRFQVHVAHGTAVRFLQSDRA